MEANTLVVTTAIQRLHFITEIQGQISDGQWENANPQDHWRVWCSLDWDDIKVGDDYGRDFYAVKTGYNLSSRDLLDVVGDRMIFKAKMVLLNESLASQSLKDHVIPDGIEDWEWHLQELDKSKIKFDRISRLCTFPVNDSPGATKEHLDEAYAIRDWDKRNLEMAALIGDVELANDYRGARSTHEHYIRWWESITEVGITDGMIRAAAASDCYMMKDLRRDMTALRKALKRDRRTEPLPQPKERKSRKRAARTEEGPPHLRGFYRFMAEAAPLQLLKTAAVSKFCDLTGVGILTRPGCFKFEGHKATFTSVRLARYMVGAGLQVRLMSTDTQASWSVRSIGSSLVVDRSKTEDIAEFVS